MTGAELPGGAAILKLGLAVVERGAPRGLAFLMSWLHGRTIVLVGQAMVGKTTLVNYVHYGIFDEEQNTIRNYEVVRTGGILVKMGRESNLQLNLKSVLDFPGQAAPQFQANLVFDSNPHGVIIILDLTRPLIGDQELASLTWFAAFCTHLETKWRVAGSKRNRLKSLIVLLNKVDKVDDSSVSSLETEVREVVKRELRQARGRLIDNFHVLPCVMVRNPHGRTFVDRVISRLAMDLR